MSVFPGKDSRCTALASDLASTTQLAKQGRGEPCYPESPKCSEVNKSYPARLPPTSHQASQDKMATPRCAENCFLKNFNSIILDPSLCATSHFSHFTDGYSGGSGRPDPPTTAHNLPPITERGVRYRDRLSRPLSLDIDRKRNYTTGGFGDHMLKREMPANHSWSFNAVDFYGF